jgi:hypothetical protein
MSQRLSAEDWRWLQSYLLHASKVEGRNCTHAHRAGRPDEGEKHYQDSRKLFRIAEALQSHSTCGGPMTPTSPIPTVIATATQK